DWHTQFGMDATPSTDRPYPLKPGTAALGSRECFRCGIVSTPTHHAPDCTNTSVPAQETKWRNIVSALVTRTLQSNTTPGTPVQLVSTIPQYPTPQYPPAQLVAHTPAASYGGYEQAYGSPYFQTYGDYYLDFQGNAEGLQQ
ncbi:hypothetical protein BV22DRAFT_1024580, partial [Leucogyrophana mollusca]